MKESSHSFTAKVRGGNMKGRRHAQGTGWLYTALQTMTLGATLALAGIGSILLAVLK
jgi:hypothetical protein